MANPPPLPASARFNSMANPPPLPTFASFNSYSGPQVMAYLTESGLLARYSEASQRQLRQLDATGNRLLLSANDPAWLVRFSFSGAVAQDMADMVTEIYAAASMITPRQGRP